MEEQGDFSVVMVLFLIKYLRSFILGGHCSGGADIEGLGGD